MGVYLGAFGQEYSISPRAKAVIDSTYNSWIKKHKVVGASIAIVEKGQIVYATGYGFSDKEKLIGVTPKTIFRIGSCTKSFTSLSLMQMHERKQIDVNHTIQEYIPELTINSRFGDKGKIYISDMLSHTSGLPCDISNGFFCDTPPDMKWVINELNKQTTMSPHKYKRAYSNIAYGLCGELIARKNNTTYSNYVKENIFKPLNMTSSYIDKDEALAPAFSKAYAKGKEMKEPLIRDQAAGLIHSSVLDMANYVMLYLNRGNFNGNQVVSEASILEMERNHLTDLTLSTKENWGYGLYTSKLMVKKDKDSSYVNLIGHGGDTYAFHADFGYIPELNLGAVILTNSDTGPRISSAQLLLNTYVKAAYGKKITRAINDSIKVVTNDVSCTPEECIGKYNMNNFYIDVKNTKEIKFKQGPAIVICKEIPSRPGNYTMRARLFRLIPISLKGQELKFAKLNNEVYMKSVVTKYNDEDYIAKKAIQLPISDNWRKHFGKYKAIEPIYRSTSCPFLNADGLTIELEEKNGFIVLKMKAKSKDLSGINYLDVISETKCVTGGIGRGTGETVSILDNGNIYYSGYEFQKMN